MIHRLFQTAFLCFLFLLTAPGTCPALAHDHEHSGHSGKSAHRLEEVTVTAKRLESFIQNNPQQVEVMGRNEIRVRHFLDTETAVDAIPGVSVEPSGTGLGARISIRGSGGTGRILVLVNGRPAGGSQYGSAVIGDIPVSMVERIEVYKPPVPVWLGVGASSGAINIVMAPDGKADGKTRPSARFRVLGGSYGTAEATASKTMSSDNQRLQLSATGKHTAGKRRSSDRDNANICAKWERQTPDAGTYDINGRYYYCAHGNPGRDYNPTPDAEQTFQKASADFRAQGMTGDTRSYKAKLFADGVRLEDRSQTGMESTLETLGVGAKGEADWCEDTGLLSVRTGASARHETVDHTLSGNHDRRQIGLHGQFDRRLGAFSVSAGARGDWTSDFDPAPGGNLGISFKSGADRIIKAGVGYTVNIPTFGQLYQPSHGSIDQVRGNPHLDEERVISSSLGFIQKMGKTGEISVTLFREDVEDLIAYQEFADTIKRPVNIADAWRCGVEINVKWQPFDQTELNLNYIRQESENEANGEELTYTPAQKFRATVKQSLKKTDTRLEIDMEAVSERFSDLENSREKRMAGYLSMDAKIAQPLKWGGHPFELFVQVRNLFDNNFEIHHGYPDDGLRAYAGFNVEL
ncbi:MAG: TonB-dependent receptor plug domain-containing protein [Desulfobacterales bacterium]